jgi:hypothetical protein
MTLTNHAVHPDCPPRRIIPAAFLVRSLCLLSILWAFLFALTPRAAQAAGSIDSNSVVRFDAGIHNGVQYVRYEAMFQGITATGHKYRTPCEIIAPAVGAPRSGVLMCDWLNITIAYTVLNRDFGLGRYALGDSFLFNAGHVYTTVRTDPEAIGLAWGNNDYDTSSEFIKCEADDTYIFADFAQALKTDPTALYATGPIQKRVAFGYSSSGFLLRGLLRMPLGQGLFDVSMAGGSGAITVTPNANGIDLDQQVDPSAPPLTSGLSIEITPESDIVWSDAALARQNTNNLRIYELAGCSHGRRDDAIVLGLASPETANPADWFPFVRALLVRGIEWADGATPPRSIWLGSPNDPAMTYDAKGNALITHLGGVPITTQAYRLPEVAVAKVQYIAVDASFLNSTVPLAFLRAICGTFVNLGLIISQPVYVSNITSHAQGLVNRGYLLQEDANVIISKAQQDLYNY